MDLIDRIYGAALAPEQWPDVFDRIGEAVGVDKLGMYAVSAARQSVIAWVGNERATPAMRAFLEGGWAPKSTQAARMLALGEPRFVSDLDVFTLEEIEVDSYYQEFLRPHGLYWGAGTFIDGPTDNKIIVTCHRPFEMGPLAPEAVEFLTQLRPHLARSAFLSTQLRLERLRGAVDALGKVGLPAAALTERGRLLLANPLIEEDIPSSFLDRPDRLHLRDASADVLFGEMIGAPEPARGGSLALKDEDGFARHILHLLPMRGETRDLFSEADWLLIAPRLRAASAPTPGILEALFDLSPAEARLAGALMRGAALAEIAETNGVSQETVRTQLKSVFRKTGVGKQVDLLRLLLAANIGAANNGAKGRDGTSGSCG